MEFGFGVPSRGPLASLENLVALAQKGEELEFDIISVSDHVVVPNSIDSTYPYNETGEFTSSVDGEYMEQLITIELPCGRDLVHQAADLGHGAATPQPRADRKDAGDNRRALPGPADRRLRSRLDEGGVRGDRRAAFRRAGSGRQRVPPRLQGALDQRRSVLRRRLLQLLEHQLRPQARTAAPSAIVDRRRESARPETSGSARRRLVSHRQQSPIPRRYIRSARRLHVSRARTRPGRRAGTLPRSTSHTASTGTAIPRPRGQTGSACCLPAAPPRCRTTSRGWRIWASTT